MVILHTLLDYVECRRLAKSSFRSLTNVYSLTSVFSQLLPQSCCNTTPSHYHFRSTVSSMNLQSPARPSAYRTVLMRIIPAQLALSNIHMPITTRKYYNLKHLLETMNCKNQMIYLYCIHAKYGATSFIHIIQSLSIKRLFD